MRAISRAINMTVFVAILTGRESAGSWAGRPTGISRTDPRSSGHSPKVEI
ncbi:uncharacterized protein METZ01_LOCUS131572 [marine metagenome]|uniref:Uncharacterized protein n=1 Tax=marine metagenome TaxID=408172 RepID=A0A381YNW8_9ZZZZ